MEKRGLVGILLIILLLGGVAVGTYFILQALDTTTNTDDTDANIEDGTTQNQEGQEDEEDTGQNETETPETNQTNTPEQNQTNNTAGNETNTTTSQNTASNTAPESAINITLGNETYTVFEKFYGTTPEDIILEITQLANGQYVFLMSSETGSGLNAHQFEVTPYLVQTDSLGNSCSSSEACVDNNSSLFYASAKTSVYNDSWIPAGMVQASGGDFFVASANPKFGSYAGVNSYLTKVDSEGTVQETYQYLLDDALFFNQIDIASDGNLLLGAGKVNDPFWISGIGNDVPSYFMLLKIDTSGAILWNKTFSFSDTDVNAMIATDDGGSILVGKEQQNNIQRGIIKKLDVNGNIEWNVTVIKQDHIGFSSVEQLGNEGYIIGGFIRIISPQNASISETQGYLAKIDPSGTIEWEYDYGGPGTQEFNAVKPTEDEGYAAIGLQRGVAADTRSVYFVKVDSEGLIQSEQFLGSGIPGLGAKNIGYDIIQNQEGGYTLVGSTSPSFSDINGFIMQTDPLGNTA